VTETDPVNERPSVQEDSQSKECDTNHNPEHGCVREDQDRDADQRCDYPERSHGAFSHRLTPLTRVYVFWVGSRPLVDGINMRRRSEALIDHHK
jgi:hypothetical protein